MITLNLDWREVLWWMEGGMAGSHVYGDMVNKVWPQASEQERRNIWLIMRRDLGHCWRPEGWSGFDLANAHGEGPWKADDNGYTIDRNNPDGKPVRTISDLTSWMYFRQVLARFDPENQYSVEMKVDSSDLLEQSLRLTPAASIIKQPSTCHLPKGAKWHSNTATLTVRAYLWKEEYYIDLNRFCDKNAIVKIEQLNIPDDETM